MRQRHPGLHAKHLRVERTEAHGAREKLDGLVRIAALGAQESAEEPGRRQVRIERERPVDECHAVVEVAAEMREGMAAPGEGYRVVLAEFDGPAGEARASAISCVRSVIQPLTLRQKWHQAAIA